MDQLPDLLRAPTQGGLMEQAYRRLKRQIIELQRPPGVVFTELEVARDWGLSKTPVREALARLHRDGHVRPLARAGYVVADITLSDAADLCDMRSLVQSEAAALCADRGLPPDTRARLVALCVDDIDGQLGGPHFEERLRANYEFEAIIANGSGNHRLAATAVAIFDDLERVARLSIRLDPSMPPERIPERRAIVDAIISREPDAARKAMRRRTSSAAREILGALNTSADITHTPIQLPGA
ncbi:GntR family transcriptional regulator [Pseudonocardia sp. GCM10023141]|uniref:GntR family transcriptional regulator n=1 Tax=Pseudonocardia sp. GCM10023141 TaxID=3252653 RepID=UPI003616B4DE